MEANHDCRLLHIGAYDYFSQSLLSIACLRGHAELASLILQIANEQYTPDEKKDKAREEKPIDNYSLSSRKLFRN
jgi:hypothetical protein